MQIIAAIAWRCAGNITFKVLDKFECFNHERQDVGGSKVAFDDEIISCQTSHWSPINDAFFPSWMITKKSGSKMFDCVNCCCVDGRFVVRFFHSDVESCQHVARCCHVLARDIDAAFQTQMVDCKTWYFFHIIIGSFICCSILHKT